MLGGVDVARQEARGEPRLLCFQKSCRGRLAVHKGHESGCPPRLVLQVLRRPVEGFGDHAGDLYVFRGARGDLIKILGMTVSACRSTPKGWREAASSGRRRRTA
jgi:hypothetical protein